MKIILTLPLLLFFTSVAYGQALEIAEPQISFVKESKPHEYYVHQAELWWEIIDKDRQNENAWYNYYRACRNAQATANWRTDFVDESPALRLGEDIVTLMDIHIPGTFTYHFVKGSTGGVTTTEGEHLLTAYRMNPDFEGLLPALISFATSSHDLSLRQEANQRWHQNRGLSAGLLRFGYNLLQSVEENAILLTQHDNDTYPVWMLQEALNIRSDVLVINIDFLLLEEYRTVIFEELGVTPFSLDAVDINEYETNWRNVVQHFLNHYEGNRPLFLSQTLSSQWWEGMEDQLYPSGLAMKFGQKASGFSWDTLMLEEVISPLEADPVQPRIDDMYLRLLQRASHPPTAPSIQTAHLVEGTDLKRMIEALISRNPEHPLVLEYLETPASENE